MDDSECQVGAPLMPRAVDGFHNLFIVKECPEHPAPPQVHDEAIVKCCHQRPRAPQCDQIPATPAPASGPSRPPSPRSAAVFYNLFAINECPSASLLQRHKSKTTVHPPPISWFPPLLLRCTNGLSRRRVLRQ